MVVLTLGRDGVLTLPAETRDELRLKEGERLEAEVVDGVLWLTPISSINREGTWRMRQESPAELEEGRTVGLHDPGRGARPPRLEAPES